MGRIFLGSKVIAERNNQTGEISKVSGVDYSNPSVVKAISDVSGGNVVSDAQPTEATPPETTKKPITPPTRASPTAAKVLIDAGMAEGVVVDFTVKKELPEQEYKKYKQYESEGRTSEYYKESRKPEPIEQKVTITGKESAPRLTPESEVAFRQEQRKIWEDKQKEAAYKETGRYKPDILSRGVSKTKSKMLDVLAEKGTPARAVFEKIALPSHLLSSLPGSFGLIGVMGKGPGDPQPELARESLIKSEAELRAKQGGVLTNKQKILISTGSAAVNIVERVQDRPIEMVALPATGYILKKTLTAASAKPQYAKTKATLVGGLSIATGVYAAEKIVDYSSQTTLSGKSEVITETATDVILMASGAKNFKTKIKPSPEYAIQYVDNPEYKTPSAAFFEYRDTGKYPGEHPPFKGTVVESVKEESPPSSLPSYTKNKFYRKITGKYPEQFQLKEYPEFKTKSMGDTTQQMFRDKRASLSSRQKLIKPEEITEEITPEEPSVNVEEPSVRAKPSSTTSPPKRPTIRPPVTGLSVLTGVGLFGVSSKQNPVNIDFRNRIETNIQKPTHNLKPLVGLGAAATTGIIMNQIEGMNTRYGLGGATDIKTKQRLATEQKLEIETITTPEEVPIKPNEYIPPLGSPFFDVPEGGGLFKKYKKTTGKSPSKYYSPSMTAIGLGIKKQINPNEKMYGLELRPIPL
jgi:hypothetical protein